jgi:hypothetical protein
MATWTKRQDGQSTIYSLIGFSAWAIHKIGRNVYLNEVNGDQFIPYPSLSAAKARMIEKAGK